MKNVIITINAVLAMGFFLIGYTGWDPLARNDDGLVAICFITFITNLIPFIQTYTQLGLNSPRICPMPEKTRMRHDKLKSALPDWKFAFSIFGLLALCLWPFIGFMFSFMCSGSLLSLYWFARAYPVAKNIFEDSMNE